MRFILKGRRTERFLPDLLIQHLTTTCEKAGKLTYAASGDEIYETFIGLESQVELAPPRPRQLGR